jgi:hypothetical protein
VETSSKAREFLLKALDARLTAGDAAWLRGQCDALSAGAPERTLHLAFGQANRKAGAVARAFFAASAAEQAQAFAVHPGWDLREWNVEQAARAALLLSLPASPATVKAILALFQTADLGENVALMRALFLLPDAGALLHIGREAIRSNMGDVFRAVTQRNPYAAEHFDEIAWNQMIVKCLFVDLPLASVHGLDARVNAELARMITGLARERWAAGRDISPEAWRCVAPFSLSGGENASVIADAFARGDTHRRAAALSLWNLPRDAGRPVVSEAAPELIPALESGALTWETP